MAAAPAQANASCVGFSQSTPGTYLCDVPPGVTGLAYTVKGGNGGSGGGGSAGGNGAKVIGNIPVTPLQTLYLTVGGNGQNEWAGGGGGYSAIASGSHTAGPLVVAGAGGGAAEANALLHG